MKTLKFDKLKDVKELEKIGVEIDFEALPEDESPEDLYCEEESANWVRKQVNNGNSAAWFCAHVTVKYKDFEGEDYFRRLFIQVIQRIYHNGR